MKFLLFVNLMLFTFLPIQILAACSCDPKDTDCLADCVGNTQDCILSCGDNTQCYNNCIGSNWPSTERTSASITRTRATFSQTSSTSVTRTTTTFASSMSNALTSTFSSAPITSVPISSFIGSTIGSTSSLTSVTSVESSPSASATSSGVTYNKVYVYDTLLITFVGFLCSYFY